MLWFDSLIGAAPLPVVGLVLLVATGGAAALGMWMKHRRSDRRPDGEDTQEGYVVSSVFGLMALLLGFTFSLAVDRYDLRRDRVLESANAIETTFLRSQLLEEPHRARMSGLLIAYAQNVVALGQAHPDEQGIALLAKDDRLLTDLWSASAAAFDSIRGIDFSSAFLDSVNQLIDADAARREARQAHVPNPVFVVLIFYLVVSAGVLGYVLSARGRYSAGFLLALMTLSLLLILDIDRPTLGTIRESQTPIAATLRNMKARPPQVFDRWRTPPPGAPAPKR